MIDNIVLGGGCFWCIEGIFQRVPGVTKVTSGYTGGETKDPTYREVCGGETGHNEVVKVEWDTDKISLAELLDVFFDLHDPTTLNRQGNDVGTQYRSGIYYNNDTQKSEAIKAIELAQTNNKDKIVTEVEKLDVFYEAEGYHQNYYSQNKIMPYCRLVITPKIEKLEKRLAESK